MDYNSLPRKVVRFDLVSNIVMLCLAIALAAVVVVASLSMRELPQLLLLVPLGYLIFRGARHLLKARKAKRVN